MRLYKYIPLTICSLFMHACDKSDVDLTGAPAAVNVINAIAGSNSDIIINNTGKKIVFADATRINYFRYDGKYANGLLTFGIPSNQDVPIIVTQIQDTSKPILNRSIICRPGDIYSLFLGGKPDQTASLLIKDSIPIVTDSITGIRFVNLSPDLNSVTINIVEGAPASKFSDLEYNKITDFQYYPAKRANLFYKFEVRDKNTDELFTTFIYNNIAVKRHVTLVIRGLKNNYPGLEIVRINNW